MVLKFVSLRAIVRIIRRSTGNVSGWMITVGNNLTIAEFTAVKCLGSGQKLDLKQWHHHFVGVILISVSLAYL
jgi:hypothetical protein